MSSAFCDLFSDLWQSFGKWKNQPVRFSLVRCHQRLFEKCSNRRIFHTDTVKQDFHIAPADHSQSTVFSGFKIKVFHKMCIGSRQFHGFFHRLVLQVTASDGSVDSSGLIHRHISTCGSRNGTISFYNGHQNRIGLLVPSIQ